MIKNKKKKTKQRYKQLWEAQRLARGHNPAEIEALPDPKQKAEVIAEPTLDELLTEATKKRKLAEDYEHSLLFFQNLFANKEEDEKKRRELLASVSPTQYGPYRAPARNPQPIPEQIETKVDELRTSAAHVESLSTRLFNFSAKHHKITEIATGAAISAAVRIPIKMLFGVVATSVCATGAAAIGLTLVAGAVAGAAAGAVLAARRNRNKRAALKNDPNAQVGEVESLKKAALKGAAFGLLGGTISTIGAELFEHFRTPVAEAAGVSTGAPIKYFADPTKVPTPTAGSYVINPGTPVDHVGASDVSAPTAVAAGVIDEKVEHLRTLAIEAKREALTAHGSYVDASGQLTNQARSFISAATRWADDPSSDIHSQAAQLHKLQAVLDDPRVPVQVKANLLSNNARYVHAIAEKLSNHTHVGIPNGERFLTADHAYRKAVSGFKKAYETAQSTDQVAQQADPSHASTTATAPHPTQAPDHAPTKIIKTPGHPAVRPVDMAKHVIRHKTLTT